MRLFNMNALKLKRRQFLKKATGALGIASLANFSLRSAADTPPVNEPKAKEELEKLFAKFEKEGKAYLCVPKKDGQFLNLLVKAVRAQNVLELGTSIGSSTIWISLGLEETGGKITTLEILPERVEMAKANVAQAGLSQRVTFKLGDAHEIVPKLDGPFDFVLLDADKDGQVDYFKKLFPKKISPGGLLLSHNAIRQRESLEDYLDLVTKNPALDTVILSATMDDGFSVSYYRKR